MISVSEAEQIINNQAKAYGVEQVSLSKSIGRILAKDITSQRDYPPFDRVAMDGICIKHEDYKNGERQFIAKGLQAAGSKQLKLIEPNTCLEIMTGAMLSDGADTVVPYEQLEKKGNTFIIKNENLEVRKNIHFKGKDCQTGSLLIKAYTRIEPHIIAILATEGMAKVPVLKLPSIAIVSTGDELVSINTVPKPYQIKASNSYMLASALQKLGITPEIFHINDDKDALRSQLKAIINNHDVILMSGGVSKGKLDYIPETLKEIGVKKEFHRIAQKPGKPFWFGSKDEKLIFAFPGNPASTLLCFKKYFESWLMLSTRQQPKNIKVKLQNSYIFKPQLTYFAQAKIIRHRNTYIAQISTGNGSGDIANFGVIDGFVELPAHEELHSVDRFYTYYKI